MGVGASGFADIRNNEELFKSIARDKKVIIHSEGAIKIQSILENDLKEVPDLEELVIEGRGVETLEENCFAVLKNLRILNLANNRIISFPGNIFGESGHDFLEEINLSENPNFVKFPDKFLSALKSLKILDVHSTGFRLVNNCFEFCGKVEILNLSGCPFTSIPSPSPFRPLRNLRELRLNRTKITELSFKAFDGLEKCTLLDLRDCQISHISPGAFERLPSVQILYLNGNRISRIENGTFSGLGHLQRLYLQKNMIEFIQPRAFKDFSELAILNLEKNRIEKIERYTFLGLDNLNELRLSYNPISELLIGGFQGLKNLQRLWLNYTKLSAINTGMFIGLSGLSSLHLDDGKIQKLDNYAFQGLHNLKFLSLNRNRIYFIARDSFMGLNNLEQLNLFQNQLEDIDQNVFNHIYSLRELSLLGNHLRFNSEYLKYLSNVMKNLSIVVAEVSEDQDTAEFLSNYHVIFAYEQNAVPTIKKIASKISQILRIKEQLKIVFDLRSQVASLINNSGVLNSDGVDESYSESSEALNSAKLIKLIKLSHDTFLSNSNVLFFLEIVQNDLVYREVVSKFDMPKLFGLSKQLGSCTRDLFELIFDPDLSEKLLNVLFRQVCSYLIFLSCEADALSYIVSVLIENGHKDFLKGLFATALQKIADIPDSQRNDFIQILNVLAQCCHDGEVYKALTTDRAIRNMEPHEIKALCLSFIKGSRFPVNASIRVYRLMLTFGKEYNDPAYDEYQAFFLDYCHDRIVQVPTEQLAALLITQKDDHGESAIEYAFKNNITSFFSHPKVKKVFSLWLSEKDYMKVDVSNRVEESNISFSSKLLVKTDEFFTTPIVKFSVRIVSSFVHLVLFVLFLHYLEFPIVGPPAALEVIMYLFAGSIVIEEFSQMISQGVNYFSSGWNTLDVTMIACFVVMLIARLVAWFLLGIHIEDDHGSVIDVIFALSAFIGIISMMVRFLHVFRFDRKFGPLLRILLGMFADIITFFVLVLIVLTGYTYGFYTILQGEDVSEFSTPLNAFKTLIYAMLSLFDPSIFNTGSVKGDIAYYLFLIYMINFFVVFMNLLIAMMSTTYVVVKAFSDAEYMFLRCQLIQEMQDNAAILPPPLTIFVYVVYAFAKLLSYVIRYIYKHDAKKLSRFWRVMCNLESHVSIDLNQFKVASSNSESNLFSSVVQLAPVRRASVFPKRVQLDSWYCSVCGYFNSKQVQIPFWNYYIDLCTRNYTQNLKARFPNPIILCHNCYQVKNSANPDVIAKQIISLFVWKCLFIYPIKIFHLPSFFYERLQIMKKASKAKKEMITEPEFKVHSMNINGNDGTRLRSMSSIIEPDRVEDSFVELTVLEERRNSLVLNSDVLKIDAPLGKEISDHLTRVEYSLSDRHYNLKSHREKIDILSSFVSQARALAESSPFESFRNAMNLLLSLFNQILDACRSDGSLNDPYLSRSLNVLENFAIKGSRVLLGTYVGNREPRVRKQSEEVFSILSGTLLSDLNAVVNSNDRGSLLSKTLKRSESISVLISLGCLKTIPGKYLRLCWRLVKVLGMNITPSEIRDIVSVPFGQMNPAWHRCAEELLHYWCTSSDVWSIDIFETFEWFFTDGTFNAEFISFAGLIDSLYNGRPSSFPMLLSRPCVGQLVSDKHSFKQFVVLSSFNHLPVIEVAPPENLDSIREYAVSNLDSHLSANTITRATLTNPLPISSAMINSARALYLSCSASLDSYDLMRLRSFSVILGTIATCCLRSSQTRKSVISNPTFVATLFEILRNRSRSSYAADYYFDVESVSAGNSEFSPLSLKDVTKNFSLTFKDPLSVLETMLRKQHLVLMSQGRPCKKHSISVFVIPKQFSRTLESISSFGILSDDSKESFLNLPKNEKKVVIGVNFLDHEDIPLLTLSGSMRDSFLLEDKLISSLNLNGTYIKDINVDVNQLKNSSILLLNPVISKCKASDLKKILQTFKLNGGLYAICLRNSFESQIREIETDHQSLCPVIELDKESWDTMELMLHNIQRFESIANNPGNLQNDFSSLCTFTWAIWETSHPVPLGSHEEVIYVSGAKYMMILFSDAINMGSKDCLEIWGKTQNSPICTLKGNYGAIRHSLPIFVSGDMVKLRYICQQEGNWGVTAFVKPLSFLEKEKCSVTKIQKMVLSKFDALSGLNMKDWAVWETDHPYSDFSDYSHTCVFEGAKNLFILFDTETSTEFGYDFLSIFQGSKPTNPIFEYVSGLYEQSFKSHQPIKVSGDTFTVKFTSDSSASFWGIRIFIYKDSGSDDLSHFDWTLLGESLSSQYDFIKEQFSPLKISTCEDRNEKGKPVSSLNVLDSRNSLDEKVKSLGINWNSWYVWETHHPYENNERIKECLIFPNASALQLVFDSSTNLEENADFLRIFNSKDEVKPLHTITGSSNHISNGIVISGGTLVLELETDSSIAFWGTRVFINVISESGSSRKEKEIRSICKFLSSNYSSISTKFSKLTIDYSLKSGAEEEKREKYATVKSSTPALAHISIKDILSQGHWYVWETAHYFGSNSLEAKQFELEVPSAKKIYAIFDPFTNLDNSWLTMKYVNSNGVEIALFDGAQINEENLPSFLIKQPFVFQGSKAIVTYKENRHNSFGARLYLFASNGDVSIPWEQYARLFSRNFKMFKPLHYAYGYNQIRKLELDSCSRIDLAVWETDHPYPNNLELFETVRIPHASKLILTFDAKCDLHAEDLFRVYKGKDRSVSALQSYTGRFAQGQRIIIDGDTVSFLFRSRGSNGLFGVKVYIKGILGQGYSNDASRVLSGIQSSFDKILPAKAVTTWDFLGPEWMVWETTHPYLDNQNDFSTVKIEGATKLLVVFDSLTKTEAGYDYVKLFKGKDQSNPLFGGQALSGDYSSNFADKDPLEIEGDTISFLFHSDGSGNYWGIRAFIKGIFASPAKPTFESEEKYSIIHPHSSYLPVSSENSSLYPIELAIESFRRLNVTEESVSHISIMEESVLNELALGFRSGAPSSSGFFVFQPYDKMIVTYHKLLKIICMIHAMRIAASSVPELSLQELNDIEEKFGQKFSLTLKLIWATGRASGQKSKKKIV